ncbi:hypothetical protein ZHAS_00003836 [Anopheles sinensis]|uniref:Uncharacterized protein n=1 Tax=Anopheles sinensis TaxID=74873 RepID=A0A084VFD1_ANOSI|nr:hypothetical protein ZHAS_00003836 [Anopheles sinensis]
MDRTTHGTSFSVEDLIMSLPVVAIAAGQYLIFPREGSGPWCHLRDSPDVSPDGSQEDLMDMTDTIAHGQCMVAAAHIKLMLFVVEAHPPPSGGSMVRTHQPTTFFTTYRPNPFVAHGRAVREHIDRNQPQDSAHLPPCADRLGYHIPAP